MRDGGTDNGTIFVVGSFVAACSVKVARLPGPGESLRAESFTLEPGGKGFNVAVAARRLGAAVDGVLAVGDDPFADFARNAVAGAGLPAAMLVRFPGPTGAGVGLVDAQGENCIAVCPAANDLLSARDITAAGARLAQARFVTAQFEVADAPILAAFAAAAPGAARVLNPSPFRAIPDGLLRRTDMLVVNRHEALALADANGVQIDIGHPDEAALWMPLARHVFALGVTTLIVTLGARGAIALTAAGARLVQPACAVAAIDTIGAGDAFLGGVLAALSAGHDLAEAMRWGAACGALATTVTGLLAALPTRSALQAFLAGDGAPAPASLAAAPAKV